MYEKNSIFLLHYSSQTTKIKWQQRKDLYFSPVISQEGRWMVSEEDFRVLLSECDCKHIQGAGNTQFGSLFTQQVQNLMFQMLKDDAFIIHDSTNTISTW